MNKYLISILMLTLISKTDARGFFRNSPLGGTYYAENGDTYEFRSTGCGFDNVYGSNGYQAQIRYNPWGYEVID